MIKVERDKFSNYEMDLATARDKFSIAMSTEPTPEAIKNLESEVSNGTKLEVVLMEMHAITMRYVKEGNKRREDYKAKPTRTSALMRTMVTLHVVRN